MARKKRRKIRRLKRRAAIGIKDEGCNMTSELPCQMSGLQHRSMMAPSFGRAKSSQFFFGGREGRGMAFPTWKDSLRRIELVHK